jgi:hypothetical protein
MLSLLQSAPLVFVASLLVGFSGVARADEAEPPSPAVESSSDELASSPSVRCVTLADGVVDLKVLADVRDVWSIDANASVGGSEGNVTLYVVSSGPTLALSVGFEKLTDKATITDPQGGTTTLAPTSTRDAVKATVEVAPGQALSILAIAVSTTPAVNAPKPVGATNKVVIKRVTICPT